LNVKASGTPPLQYQWQSGTANIPAANDFRFETAQQGAYRVVIQNNYGAVTSDVATVVIQDPPMITQHPSGDTVLAGATVTLTSAASGTGSLTYQWRFDGVNIPGANSPTLVLQQMQPSQSGRYTVRVSNAVGSAISQEAVVIVLAPPSVNVVAIDPNAAEAGLDPGAFQITRVGTTNFSIAVNLMRSGSATSGADFGALPASVSIPAGGTSAIISLIPVNDATREAAETVILQVATGTGYTVGSPNSATVTIADDDNALPTISITSPPQLSLYPITPVAVQFTVNTADSDGSVQSVDYFNHGTNHLGTATVTPFTFTWTNALPGTNRITAVARDELGALGTSGVLTFFVNIPPKVAITSPTDGDAVPPGGSNIVIRASASDADGTVVRVEFFEGATLLGAVTNAPFNFSWGSSQVGLYSLRAVATDNRGMSTESASVRVTVRIPNNSFADMFADRGQIFGYANVVNGSNLSATREPGEPRAYNGSTRTVWLRWVAPATGPCTIHTVGSSFDTVLAVFTNNPVYVESITNLGLVAENDDSINVQSLVQFQALEDVPYQIRVEGYGADAGPIVLTQTLSTRAPRVVTHPQNVLVLTGATANFTFSATATMPYTNQWRLNGTNLPGATGQSLVVTNVVPGKDGDYTVLVGNAFGFDISHPGRLEIGSRPRLILEPVSQTVLEGGPAMISVTVEGSLPMTYRWRKGSVYVYEYTTNSLFGFIAFSSVHMTNAGTYTVGVTNVLGPAARLSLAGVLTVLADADRDRMADSWEALHGFDSDEPADAFLDADGDGMENWKEYVAGTHPRDATSYLKVNPLMASPGQATVTFNAVSNRSYIVQFTDQPGASWSQLQAVSARTTNRVVSVIDPAALNSTRFYRLAIP
jgi:hypothetical protein